MRVFLFNLMLMGLWVASTGVFTYSNGLLGFAVGYLVLYWLQPLVGVSAYFGKLPLVFLFSFSFLWEVCKASLRVAWDVITPKNLRRPGIVAIPLDARTDLEIALLANLITLTPGSLCIDVSKDRQILYVHEMFVDDPEAIRQYIKTRFERRLLRLLRDETPGSNLP